MLCQSVIAFKIDHTVDVGLVAVFGDIHANAKRTSVVAYYCWLRHQHEY